MWDTWDIAVLVVRWVCIGVLAAGAVFSLWFKFVDRGRSEAPAPQPLFATEAIVKEPSAEPPALKRAA